MITLLKITKSYFIKKEEFTNLKGIALTIKKGEFVALMGPSGSGKSTLLNLIGALDRPTSGEYVLNGKKIDRLSTDELADIRNKEIGFIFQSFQLIPTLSSLENVALPSFYAGNSNYRYARDLLSLVGLEGRFDSRPNELSGGQKQRVAIARALINNPALILADEPTGNLDSKTGEKIMKLILKLKSEYGKTILMVTHDPLLGKLADRTVQLKDGLITRKRQE